jgi:tetratricopeptide (TPR) repeat protein
MTRLALTVLLAIAGSAGAQPKVDPPPPNFRQKAAEHFQAGRYAEALAELETAYKLDPAPGLLYAIAQVQVKLDRCADAIVNYEKFVASNPGEKPAQAANEAIAACKVTLAAKKPEPRPELKPEPKPESKPEPKPVLTPDPPRRDDGGRAWFKDPLGGALVGAGLIGGVVGVVLYRSASADIDAAESAANYGSSEELVDGAKSKRRNALIAGGVGGALLIGGVIRYATSGGRETKRIAIVPTTGGAAVSWSGRW